MKREASENGTPVYQRLHRRGLTLPQLSAIDLLASGKTDTETAELLNLSRTCISKWRLYDPLFQSGLNCRRPEVWGSGIDRLRSLIPKALDVLADMLEKREDPGCLKAAIAILRLVPLPADALQSRPTDPEAIVSAIVKARRSNTPGGFDEMFESSKGLPPFPQQLEQTWDELERLANASDEDGAHRNGAGTLADTAKAEG